MYKLQWDNNDCRRSPEGEIGLHMKNFHDSHDVNDANNLSKNYLNKTACLEGSFDSFP